MDFDEQDSFIESLRKAFDEAGTITDNDIRCLFAKKNHLADEPDGTSYEFDDFFSETICEWAENGLTDEKATLLLELINSEDGCVDDSEDALLEELAMLELTGTEVSGIIKDKFPEYFE